MKLVTTKDIGYYRPLGFDSQSLAGEKTAMSSRPPYTIGGAVLTPIGSGVSNAKYANVPSVVKTNEAAVYCVPNEYISGEIGRFLGLPIPPGGIVSVGENPLQLGYLALRHNLASGMDLPPVNPSLLWSLNPNMCTGIVLFDILVANCDRHTGNIAATYERSDSQLVLFDHGHALLGPLLAPARRETARKFVSDRLKSLNDENRLGISGGLATGHNRHCLLDVITDDRYFPDWFSKIESLPSHFISKLVQETENQGLVDFMERSLLFDFLSYRSKNIRGIVHLNISEFTKLIQRGLNL